MNFSENLRSVLDKQRQFFESGKTRSVAVRIAQLKKLKATMQAMEAEILSALKSDLHKSPFEGYTSEVGFVYEEINRVIKQIKRWAKPKKVPTPWLLFPSRSYIYAEPKGVVLIIGTWNYPLQLILSPLVGAVAAGNCALIKPSEIATSCEAIIKKIIAAAFPEEWCSVVTGGIDETKVVLEQKFDHIFFTGSTTVGKIVAKTAAPSLTPVTLELGGKSPCIVDEKTNLLVTARRIVWGKFYNAGQTCVAPDYLLVHSSVKAELVQQMKSCLRDFFGANPALSPDYGRIINAAHFNRLKALLRDGKILEGGTINASERYIAPTLMDNVALNSKIMSEEIFGPILPILEFKTPSTAISIAKHHPTPLACYIFSDDTKFCDEVMTNIAFGGGCINNTLIHLANLDLPFGGVGTSGMGAYHGKTSFELFSHYKSIVKTPFFLDLLLKYPPYKNRLQLIRKILR